MAFLKKPQVPIDQPLHTRYHQLKKEAKKGQWIVQFILPKEGVVRKGQDYYVEEDISLSRDWVVSVKEPFSQSLNVYQRVKVKVEKETEKKVKVIPFLEKSLGQYGKSQQSPALFT